MKNYEDIKWMLPENERNNWDKEELTKKDQKEKAKNLPRVAEFLNKLKGKKLLEKGFMSVSLNKAIAARDFKGFSKEKGGGIFFRIKINPGIRAFPIFKNSKYYYEDEILLNKGTELTINAAKVNSAGTITLDTIAESQTTSQNAIQTAPITSQDYNMGSVQILKNIKQTKKNTPKKKSNSLLSCWSVISEKFFNKDK